MFNIAHTFFVTVVLGLSLAATAWQGLPSNALIVGPMMAAETSQQVETVALQPQTVTPVDYGIGRPIMMSDDAIELVRTLPLMLSEAVQAATETWEETMS